MGLTVADCRFCDNLPFRLAALNRSIKSLDWLKDMGITADDCRVRNHEALRRAVKNEHEEIAAWLHGMAWASWRPSSIDFRK